MHANGNNDQQPRHIALQPSGDRHNQAGRCTASASWLPLLLNAVSGIVSYSRTDEAITKSLDSHYL